MGLEKGKARMLKLEQIRQDMFTMDHILRNDTEIYDWWKNIRSD
jgi:hypothetical protein